MSSNESGSLVAQRTLQILLSFQEKSELTLTEIANIIGISNTAAFRILTTLHDMGFVTRDRFKRYSLGPILLRLARNVNPKIREAAVPILEEISKEAQESVYLSVSYEPDKFVFIAKAEGEHPLKWSADIGVPISSNAGSVGKAHLAFNSERNLEKVLSRIELVPYTENTIIDKEELLKELIKIRKQGHAVTDSDRYEGVIGISVPIYDSVHDNVLGILSIFIPKSRWEEGKLSYYISALKMGSDKITTCL